MLYSATIDETEREIYSAVIGELKNIIILSIDNGNKTPEEIANLRDSKLLLEFEQKAVLGEDETARSIQDKVKQLYIPILRSTMKDEQD